MIAIRVSRQGGQRRAVARRAPRRLAGALRFARQTTRNPRHYEMHAIGLTGTEHRAPQPCFRPIQPDRVWTTPVHNRTLKSVSNGAGAGHDPISCLSDRRNDSGISGRVRAGEPRHRSQGNNGATAGLPSGCAPVVPWNTRRRRDLLMPQDEHCKASFRLPGGHRGQPLKHCKQTC
jgi:hypothetical protein